MTTADHQTSTDLVSGGQLSQLPAFTWGPYVSPRRNPANLVTACGFIMGIVIIALAQRGYILVASAFVAGATITDLLDGTIARATGTDKLPYPVGHQLDFVSDTTWAALGGAAILYYGQLHTLPVIGPVVVIGWCLAGAFRLVRYTVMGHSDNNYLGCPAPLAADIVVIVAVLNVTLIRVSVILTAILAVALSVAMLSWFRLPTWSAFGRQISDRVVAWTVVREFIARATTSKSGDDA